MAFPEGCRRYFHKPAIILQFLDCLCAAISHTRAETTHQLKYSVLHISFVGNASFNALRHKLLRIGLEITVLAPILHGCNRAHAPVHLVFSSLKQLECSWTLLTACEDAAHHADTSTSRDRLCHIAGILDAAVRNNRNIVLLRHCVGVHDCRDLRNTNTGDNTRRADRSWTNSDLNRICSRLDQRLRALPCSNIARDDL